ncbi:uncharacterized protein TRIADDRAFT_32305 [Trichoplax adhaerens]|uniref:TAP42-like protein n=1 Tax=Trichoplax adhaerens TaxID=10228 RepID=B3SAI4_TRIAD|nr:hypothetical protein TRIADDRAFT_32305 [Trichoplax adhaerens]EDV20317.1 hypothetical protein TRIADDRAFT_32305 [Trichoplax adhaerens]|eukprot:XP_002117267.1 hypothetical protein TRIADDRAFT_32305 [Trichoplax adhaerens]
MAAHCNDDSQHLVEIYTNATRLHQEIETTGLSSSSSEYQQMVADCINDLHKVAGVINQLGLFSRNEVIDDVTTVQLGYFIVNALLADLNLKLQNSNLPHHRLQAIHNAKTHIDGYLQLCRDYNLYEGNDMQDSNKDDPLPSDDQLNSKQLAMAQYNKDTKTRQAKIERYQQLQEQEKKMKIIEKLMQQDKYPLDEETIRQHRILQIQSWINKSLDQLDSIQSEMKILQHMIKMKKDGKDPITENLDKKRPIPNKPIVITREMIKNKVFGAGYPSLPTMSPEEYLEKEIREGKVVLEYDKSLQTKKSNKSGNDEEEEDNEDSDDEEALQKARKWDDWKDNHKRGWGNRMNKG